MRLGEDSSSGTGPGSSLDKGMRGDGWKTVARATDRREPDR
ncbi:hypothetical protein LI99_21975 [Mycolicibacterium smegmatis]|uniref:Uncharacterized protein n=2 Tax=Mycolicibacterium smegmatis (strain ATCC 700084 / mc(2)155) TaxID=246196 RepID=A0R0M5_MYCS2|nr:hypothetical protein MSMEG_4438 [Mycolicibacterium smegmatis MC2 155]AIU16142.1 hypothetical protein LI99_21975 [Mycolicibacterium smegmatis]AFP40786.1 hypothetical protein MSMEI_4330 [Mycolicibacterium smegmatis MC2 155]AIU09517.1 hypothetical protein LJ00_21970 [Mycolicibacterium smegmatis MC2 155]AIU22765.1 hypothetical protein LI98_21980 [Mycolicibacterium smegmatis]